MDRIGAKLLRTLLIIYGCTYFGWDAAAQFTITDKPSETFSKPDTIRKLPQLNSPFYSPAQARIARAARRKERNTFEVTTALTLTQTQFDNWASGGDNTFNAKATVFLSHLHKRKRLGFDTKLDARYGMNRIDKKMFKNDDFFKLVNKMSWDINSKWSYSAVFDLRSQFSVGHKSRMDKTKVSHFMSPGFFEVSVGFTYGKNPWNITMSPVGGSAVFVIDDELSAKGINGVPAGKRSKWKVGPSVRVSYDSRFAKNIIRLRSDLYCFSNIRKPPIIKWETRCEIKATKFLSTVLRADFRFDKDANTPKAKHLQSKYEIEVGLAYTFKNK